MKETILVNLHCHSLFSDGEQTPEVLAGNLAAAGVRFAALTDHDTLEGLPRFQTALKKHNIGFLPGVEITALYKGREIHILGYGIDTTYPELEATLLSLRQVRTLDVHSIAGSLRKAGNNHSGLPEESAAPQGQLAVENAISLIHRAGGLAFWAHPLFFENDPQNLESIILELKSSGLDGLEAHYTPFSAAEQESLCSLAKKHELLVSAGTDFHGLNGPGNTAYAVKMPREDWNNFRRVLFSGSADKEGPSKTAAGIQDQPEEKEGKPHRFRRRSFVVRIFLPTLVAILLFLSVLWGVVLPSFEETLMERKRELIHELTNSAWSILSSYYRDEQAGLLTRAEAQEMAVTRIEALRYGTESKDYFWIQDMQPRMIMHPYRPDLNGQDLSDITDPRGVAIFVEFASLVKRDGEGYIDYVWQWNDDPQRLEPKESYVKGFEPWGWIIGTGIYIDDVHQEIGRIKQSLITTSFLVSGAVVVLLFFVLQQSLRIERERQEVVDDLRESTGRYHALVESTTEGTLLVLDERCRYANPTFLNMLGYSLSQLEFLDLADLLPREADNELIWDFIQGKNGKEIVNGKARQGCLQHKNGGLVECVLTLNPVVYAGQQGFILLARDISHPQISSGQDGLGFAARLARVGIFRARALRRGVFLEINQTGSELLSRIVFETNQQPSLADLFSTPADYQQFFQSLLKEEELSGYLVYLETRDANARLVSLSARLVKDENQQPDLIVGFLEDVTARHRQEAEAQATIEKLQTSLLFLHESLDKLGREVVICKMDTSIEQLARIMTTRKATAALVAAENETIIGIITDHDLRARALAENIDLKTPVHTIMSSPITKISENALVYEALMHMEEKGVRHLAVEDRSGKIVSVIDNKSLIQFQRYGPIVLAREISRSQTVEDLARQTARLPLLAKTLTDSSANPRHITNMVSSICNAVTERLIEMAVEEFGPPPASFAFIGMGSQGRQEQTLLTDQDNGIIYRLSAENDPQEVQDYFLRLGSRVCDGLHLSGYPYCRGQVMAGNPAWCRSLEDWMSGFESWVVKSEPQEIINLSIFFDFRTIYGDKELTRELRRHVYAVLQEKPGIFYFFAQNALLFKPPMRLLGGLYVGEHGGEINLKDAMLPMVSFARLYALHHQVNQVHTLERLETLAERNHILPSTRDEITSAYNFLMQLRLQAQLEAIQAGQPPHNNIQPARLGNMQQELLKQAFVQISAVQKKISYDFLGGM